MSVTPLVRLLSYFVATGLILLPFSFVGVYYRAVDNQVYVASISPARDEKATYVAWGHTTAVNPW